MAMLSGGPVIPGGHSTQISENPKVVSILATAVWLSHSLKRQNQILWMLGSIAYCSVQALSDLYPFASQASGWTVYALFFIYMVVCHPWKPHHSTSRPDYICHLHTTFWNRSLLFSEKQVIHAREPKKDYACRGMLVRCIHTSSLCLRSCGISNKNLPCGGVEPLVGG